MNDRSISPSIPPSKKNKLVAYGLAVIASLCIVCLVIVLAVQFGSSTSKPQPTTTDIPTDIPQLLIPAFPAPVNTSSIIQYQISGNVFTASVTLQNGTSDNEQYDIRLPWTYSAFHASSGQFVYISAQISDNNPGTITCTILLNGHTYKTSTSSGQYVIVQCSGLVP